MATKNINISEYANTLTNFTLIDGLTPDMVKVKYIWLLNAIVENAIIGEDDYGLVWYSGSWIAGEWEDGTWYSGIWYDGEWKNGNFYSYRFDTKQLLLRNKRILEKNNPTYSQFRSGIWRRGKFYNGYFGPETYEERWENATLSDIVYWYTRWEGGDFFNGVFRNSAWMQMSGTTGNKLDSNFHNGIFYNSEWVNGTFLNGTFQGYRWWDGNFTGGDFVKGDWINGKFNQGSPNIKSRFGSWPLTGSTELAGSGLTTWHNGQFINGEFHSGLNIISGVTSVSNNHNRSHWINGTWQNGVWYGGTHRSGSFNNGYWYEGFWSGGTFNNGYWINGFWLSGTINNGYFIQGIFKDVTFKGGQLGYQAPEWLIKKQSSNSTQISIPPKIFEG